MAPGSCSTSTGCWRCHGSRCRAQRRRWAGWRSGGFRSGWSRIRHRGHAARSPNSWPMPAWTVDASAILTAVSSAARYLDEHYRGAGCLVVNEGPLEEDLEGVEIVEAAVPASCCWAAPARVSATNIWMPSSNWPSTGCRWWRCTATPGTRQRRDRRWTWERSSSVSKPRPASRSRSSASRRPSSSRRARRPRLGPADALMVGDDIGSDVRGAQAVGITGVLVRTGKFRPSDLDGTRSGAGSPHRRHRRPPRPPRSPAWCTVSRRLPGVRRKPMGPARRCCSRS